MCNRNGNRFTRAFGDKVDGIRVRKVVSDPYTQVTVRYNGKKGVGFAKRNPCDEPNPDMGVQIAYGRAMQELAEECGLT